MGKKSKPKIEVTLYYMSLHYGACVSADAIRAIYIKEKLAWEGYVSSQGTISISERELFGGDKKEGGVEGLVYWLPGASDQILPDPLAVRLGRANGLDTPGFRGICSAFFVGNGPGASTGGDLSVWKLIFGVGGGVDRGGGFYWSANVPYLPGTWLTLERAPQGLTQTYVRILRLGVDEFPVELPPDGDGHWIGTAFEFGPTNDYMVYWGSNGSVEWWNPLTREIVGTSGGLMFTGSVTSVALDSSGTAYYVGNGGVFNTATIGNAPIMVDTFAPGTFFDITRALEPDGEVVVFTAYAADVGYLRNTTLMTYVDSGRDFCLRSDGSIIGVFQPDGASSSFSLIDVTDSLDPTPPVLATLIATARADITSARICHVEEFGHYFVWMDSNFYIVDDTTLTITSSGAMAFTPDLPAENPYRQSFWNAWSEYSLEDGSLLRTVDPNDWLSPVSEAQQAYNPWDNSIWSKQAGTNDFIVRELDRGIYDANPSHIIFECLTNTDWGMGSPESAIDVDSFEAAGVTLYNEDFGLSMIWTRQAAIQNFVQEVLDHIQAVLFVDPSTGLLTLKLIRDDYDEGSLPILTPSNADLSSFARKLWGEIVNEINVTWTNPENEQEETVTVQDLGSIAVQGGIVSDSRNYYGVRTKTLAQRLGARDLRSAGAPLATCEALVNREQWALRPASVVKVTWPEHGLSNVVMRVVNIDYGRPGSPEISLSLIEDVYGLDTGDYIEPPGSAWLDPSSEPEPLEIERVLTLPLFFAANTTAAAYLTPAYPDVLAGVLGTTSDEDTFNFELWDEVTLPDGSLEWQQLSTNNIIGHAELAADVDAEVETTLSSVANFIGGTGPTLGGFVLIGDGGETLNEIALITDTGTQVTVTRGVLDTVPRAWPAGTPIWFVDAETLFEDPLTRAAGEAVSYKMRSRTSRGLLPLGAAPLVEYTLTERPWLPYRPADAKVDGVAFNTFETAVDMTAASDVPVTWANRNRLLEETQVLAWDDATVAPEDGQTTTLEVVSADGLTVLDTITGLTGTSYDVPVSSFGGEDVGIIRFIASRTDADGTFESLQAHEIYVRVDGSVRRDEASQLRMTEEGDVRVTED